MIPAGERNALCETPEGRRRIFMDLLADGLEQHGIDYSTMMRAFYKEGRSFDMLPSLRHALAQVGDNVDPDLGVDEVLAALILEVQRRKASWKKQTQ